MERFIPGPWELVGGRRKDQHGRDTWSLYQDSDDMPCVFHAVTGHLERGDEIEGNVRLACAAPDFVAACEELPPDGDIPAELRLRWLSALISSFEETYNAELDEDADATSTMLSECRVLYQRLLDAYRKATGHTAPEHE